MVAPGYLNSVLFDPCYPILSVSAEIIFIASTEHLLLTYRHLEENCGTANGLAVSTMSEKLLPVPYMDPHLLLSIRRR